MNMCTNSRTYFYTLQITNMVMVQIFDIIYGKLNVVRIFISGSFAQKWITESYNCSFIVPETFTIQTEAFEGK
jgi:hypothetical protein